MKISYLSTRVSVILIIFLFVTSCKEKQEQVNPNSGSDTTSFAVEDAYPDTKCVWQDGKLFGTPIRYGIINNEAIFEGDIILTPEQLADPKGGRVKGAGTNEKILRWRNFTIPYTIDPNLPKQFRVTDAIAHWEARTPIRFVVRTNEPDYITFKVGSGCDSHIGRIGTGQQFIRLASGCTTGSTIHEIGHAVGLLHEQTRSDRDNFVTIHKDNIIDNDEDQFIKYTEDDEISGFNFGEYDFSSIMHYPWNAFAIDKTKPTITRNDGGGEFTFGIRNELSIGDIRTVTAMYASLYIIWGNNLYAVCVKDGSYALVSKGWSGTTAKTVAEDDRYVWAIHEETLWRVNRLTGTHTPFGGGWNGALGVTSIMNPSHLWAIKGSDLYAIDKKTGKATDVDNLNWSGAKSIFAHRDFLFVVEVDGELWKLDMNTGKWSKMDGVWTDPKAIASATPGSENIYIINESTLWRVNIFTGNIVPVGPDYWQGAEGMVGIGGKLYVVQGGTLWEADENNRRSLSGGWQGTKSMGVIRNGNIL